MNHERNSSLRI